MPRLSLAVIIPPALLAITLVLFIRSWTAEPPAGPPPPTTAAMREQQGLAAAGSDVGGQGLAAGGLGMATGNQVQQPAANAALPPGEMNPVPAGTPDLGVPGNPPAAATPTAPSGEPARAPGGG
ncbi:hypothetical protein [Roseicella aerolata]|uniref:Uncharacterized protein n=1 Tax=Roseicella aerolata TaxID=2883479 RepID=A0A9X1LBH8_9PROT|nr:hypothetical protein [Roseicella aerolata]MCB4822517.1 hypothetical protein [Roseicella aerolata]